MSGVENIVGAKAVSLEGPKDQHESKSTTIIVNQYVGRKFGQITERDLRYVTYAAVLGTLGTFILSGARAAVVEDSLTSRVVSSLIVGVGSGAVVATGLKAAQILTDTATKVVDLTLSATIFTIKLPFKLAYAAAEGIVTATQNLYQYAYSDQSTEIA